MTSNIIERSRYFESNMLGKFKVVFLGESSVGKTSLINRFLHDHFDIVYRATVGIDFMTKRVLRDDQKCVKFQIWDTAGQERFRSLIPSYVHKSSVAVIVYDITNAETFYKGMSSKFCSNENQSCHYMIRRDIVSNVFINYM